MRISFKGMAAGWMLVLGALRSGPAIGSQNLVANGQFDLDIDGWSVVSPQISDLEWDDFDATSCGPLSGSALATNFSIVASGSAAFAYCVPGVVAGETYSFGGRLRFPTGQAQTGYGKILLLWAEQEDCLGNVLGTVGSDVNVLSETAGTWVRTRNDAVVAPAGSQAAIVRVFLLKDSHTGALDMFFDSVYLVPEPGYLFADSFENDSLCRWSAEVP
jgi:hypothetical protein